MFKMLQNFPYFQTLHDTSENLTIFPEPVPKLMISVQHNIMDDYS